MLIVGLVVLVLWDLVEVVGDVLLLLVGCDLVVVGETLVMHALEGWCGLWVCPGRACHLRLMLLLLLLQLLMLMLMSLVLKCDCIGRDVLLLLMDSRSMRLLLVMLLLLLLLMLKSANARETIM